MENVCLTSYQAWYIYEKVEKDSLVNVQTVKQEIEEDRIANNNDNEEDNLYQSMILNDLHRINVNVNTSQMEQWSMLSSY